MQTPDHLRLSHCKRIANPPSGRPWRFQFSFSLPLPISSDRSIGLRLSGVGLEYLRLPVYSAIWLRLTERGVGRLACACRASGPPATTTRWKTNRWYVETPMENLSGTEVVVASIYLRTALRCGAWWRLRCAYTSAQQNPSRSYEWKLKCPSFPQPLF